MEARKIIENQLKDLYALRSKIVHTGTGQVRDSDLSLAQHLSKSAALRVLTESAFAGMASDSDLEAWFDEKVLK